MEVRRVHWLCWHPTPYLQQLFESVARSRHIDLHVHYLRPVLATHPWKSSFSATYRSRVCRLHAGIDWRLLSLGVKDPEAYFLVSTWNHPCSQALLSVLRMLSRSYGIWTDTPNVNRKRYAPKAWARDRWLRWIFSRATHLLATGTPGIKALAQMGAPKTRLVNFPFYIDLAAYTRENAENEPKDRVIRFLSVGRLYNFYKGHDLAIRALAKAIKHSAMPFEYNIAGAGTDEHRLRQLTEELGLEGQVHFLGWLEPEETKSLYRKSHVLIHPSPIHDPFPNAVLEAMAAGLVVVGSDVSGSAVDRIEHGINGLLHRAGDVQELSEQLICLLTQPHRIAEMGRQARETAECWPMERAVATIENMVL